MSERTIKVSTEPSSEAKSITGINVNPIALKNNPKLTEN